MKIENRITWIIVFLLIINLFYFKIAKNIFEETSKVIETQYILNTFEDLNTNKNQISLLQTNELLSDIEKTNQEVVITNEIQPSKTTDNDKEQNTNHNQEDIIDEIGNNISEGVRPFPLSNGNITMIEQLNLELSEENTKLLDINKAEISEEIESKHLVSFLIILVIVTAISLSIIAYQEHKSRKTINQFNIEVGDNQGYYLLSD